MPGARVATKRSHAPSASGTTPSQDLEPERRREPVRREGEDDARDQRGAARRHDRARVREHGGRAGHVRGEAQQVELEQRVAWRARPGGRGAPPRSCGRRGRGRSAAGGDARVEERRRWVNSVRETWVVAQTSRRASALLPGARQRARELGGRRPEDGDGEEGEGGQREADPPRRPVRHPAHSRPPPRTARPSRHRTAARRARQRRRRGWRAGGGQGGRAAGGGSGPCCGTGRARGSPC